MKKPNPIQHYKEASRTIAMPALVRAWHELNKNGFTDNGVMINYNDEALAYTVRGRIVGVMSFTHIDHMKELFVKLGFVEPRYRRRGIYAALWAALVAQAVDRGIPFITGSRHVLNRRKAMVDRRMRRDDLSIQTIFAVPLRSVP